MTLRRIEGYSGEWLDLPEEVVDRFKGKEHDLKLLIDTYANYLFSDRTDFTGPEIASALQIAAKKGVNDSKGKPDPWIGAAADQAQLLIDRGWKQADAIRHAVKYHHENAGVTVTESAVRQRLWRKK